MIATKSGRPQSTSDAGRVACTFGNVQISSLGGLGNPFRLDPFLAFLGRAPTFRAAFSEISAGFAESRPDTASSKARR